MNRSTLTPYSRTTPMRESSFMEEWQGQKSSKFPEQCLLRFTTFTKVLGLLQLLKKSTRGFSAHLVTPLVLTIKKFLKFRKQVLTCIHYLTIASLHSNTKTHFSLISCLRRWKPRLTLKQVSILTKPTFRQFTLRFVHLAGHVL